MKYDANLPILDVKNIYTHPTHSSIAFFFSSIYVKILILDNIYFYHYYL